MKVRSGGAIKYESVNGGPVNYTVEVQKWDREFFPKLMALVDEAYRRGLKIVVDYSTTGEEFDV